MRAFVDADPNDAFARYGLALEYRGRGDHAEAIAQLEQLRARDPQYVALYYPLGGLYADAARPEDARSTYAAGIAVAQAQGDAHTAAELAEALELVQ